MIAIEKLKHRISRRLHVCVGLDTDFEKLPHNIKQSSSPILNFNKKIIDATYESAAAYKLNLAFYEKLGAEGFQILLKTVEYIPDELLVIGDAKRGDIGNTSRMYAEAIFNYFKFDAVTINPYMGYDSVQPFLEFKDKLSFILTLTSNKGANDFEKLRLEDGSFLYQSVINKVVEWNQDKNCGIVFGATNPDELIKAITILDQIPVLLPGIGAQGGDLEEVVTAFKNSNHTDFLINVSRSLIYVDNSDKFADAAAEKLMDYNRSIKKLLNS